MDWLLVVAGVILLAIGLTSGTAYLSTQFHQDARQAQEVEWRIETDTRLQEIDSKRQRLKDE